MRLVIALSLVLVALLSSCGKREKETVVARVGKGKVTAEQMDARFKSLPPQVARQYEGEEGQKRFLDGFIEEETWYQAALEANLAKDEEIQRQVDEAVRRILIQNYFERELRPYQVLTEEQLRKIFDENIQEYTKAKEMKVRHIQVPTRSEAESLRRRILAGEDMAELARKHSKNEYTAKDGGLIGYVPETSSLIAYIGACTPLTVAIDSTPIMEVSDVIECAQGFQVIRVEEIIPEAPFDFEKVKEAIRRIKQPEYEAQVRAERLASLKEKLGVEISQVGVSETKRSREEEAEALFQRAQESKEWQERLDLYNEFRQKFPDHAKNCEALFMIGFIYAEELKDYAKAQDTFNQLVKDYPDCNLAKDAKYMLDNLGVQEPPAPAASGDAPAAGTH